ncbi:MAG: hypothetical protein KAR76_05575 [Methanosarcinales archaeon]|nr:hypothetical protein [Methanosarcinales archaeon]
MPFQTIESVLFDTSFLLNDSGDVDNIIKILHKDRVSCYISRTIQSEMDDLYYVGRISKQKYNKGLARCRKARASLLDSSRNFLQGSMTKECTVSMEQEHGTKPGDAHNDCSILTSSLYNYIDLILSEDFHFTSMHTDKVVDSVIDMTCERFDKLCGEDILLLNKDGFLAAYKEGQVDLEVVEAMKQDVRKGSKVLKKGNK